MFLPLSKEAPLYAFPDAAPRFGVPECLETHPSKRISELLNRRCRRFVPVFQFEELFTAKAEENSGGCADALPRTLLTPVSGGVPQMKRKRAASRREDWLVR